MSGRPIPAYSYDGSYIDHITIRRAERLEEMGRAKIVRHRKGRVNRSVLLRPEGEPHITRVQDYVGQAYAFHQLLPDGNRPWKLRSLAGRQKRRRRPVRAVCHPRRNSALPEAVSGRRTAGRQRRQSSMPRLRAFANAR